jgi:DNA polymerase
MLKIDIETRSEVDLLKVGSYKYASHPSTQIICIGWELGIGHGVAYSFDHLPAVVQRYICEKAGLVATFNVGFDRLIWEALAPDHLQISLERWYCVSAECRVNAIPAGLNNAHRMLTGDYGKDIRGPQLIKLLSLPRDDGTFNKDPDLIREMGAYCQQDVTAMSTVMSHTRRMTKQEHRDFLLNEAMNDDGVEVDRLLATLAVEHAETEKRSIGDRLEVLTDEEVTSHTQTQRIRNWFIRQVDQYANGDKRRIMSLMSRGEKKSLDKGVRQRLMSGHDDGVFKLPGHSREVIELMDSGNKSSVAKFQKMIDMADKDDDRVRGAFLYAGASQTLRYSSRGLQLHNFKRDCFDPEETSEWITHMSTGRTSPGMDELAKMLRPALVPSDGNVFVVSDWAQIEARALPWLSGEHEQAEDRLAGFRLHDADPTTDDLYTITSNRLNLGDRQLGKIAELALGYGGGAGAFQSMAQLYGVFKPVEEVEDIVISWREANQWAVQFWNELESAAIRAVQDPDITAHVGKVAYQYHPHLLGGTLVCTLPGGSTIQYPRCTYVDGELSAIKANWTPAKGETEWPRVGLWRGLLAENVTQAFCAALLRDTVDRCYQKNVMTVGHVHDEIIAESSWRARHETLQTVKSIMEKPRKWTTGLPLKADAKIMRRYGK